MIQIPLTPDKYQAAITRLEGLVGSDITSLHLGGPVGQVITPQVTLEFTYDGTSVNITILEKHGFAKFASDNTIKAHLEDLLTGV